MYIVLRKKNNHTHLQLHKIFIYSFYIVYENTILLSLQTVHY